MSTEAPQPDDPSRGPAASPEPEGPTGREGAASKVAGVIVWGTLVLVVMVLGALLWRQQPLGVGRAAGEALPVIGVVTPFTLTNQHEQPVSLPDLAGKVWVADVIFTRCPGPCVRMTRLMAELQGALRGEEDVRLVSLTADPAYDRPAVLREYATRFGADSTRWDFLTGPKAEVYRLAMDGLKLSVAETAEAERTSPEDLFLHSTKLVVVDRAGRLRAVCDGEDPASRDRVARVVRQLSREQPETP